MFTNKAICKFRNSIFFQTRVRTLCQKATKSRPNKNILSGNKIIHYAYGQPTCETHPHLIGRDEITPWITKREYQTRRETLLENILTYSRLQNPEFRHHIVVIPSATKQYMSDKIPYVFRQNTDFLYLTGCQEPDSCLILSASESPNKHTTTLFVREKDDHSELWDGPRTGPENVPDLFGIENSLPIKELENYLHTFMRGNKNVNVWYDIATPIQMNVHRTMCDYINGLNSKCWESPKSLIHKQRLIKSPCEIKLMQKTCDIASNAIIKTIQMSKPGIDEHQIFATVDYECRMNGAEFLAYPPVVAGGNRANFIHYINNNQIVRDGEMVLMDAGCEFHGYASDITRTWPINGEFSPQQKELYSIVLDVQQELIKSCANFPSLDSLFNSMCLLLGKRLYEIGIIENISGNQGLMRAAYQFCPHHVSHYLGMDVHDTPSVLRGINIKPGMIITVEPGIYISHKHQVPVEYRGLGVRIEDDVLITDAGPVVLSKKCPKTVEDIEKIAKQ